MHTLSAQHTLSDFDFSLPDELIAQEPVPVRDRSRLLVLDRTTPDLRHLSFSDIRSLLRPGDLLVLNDTRVLPCRIIARKPGGGRAELFLLEEQGTNRWTALVRGGLDRGRTVTVADGIEAEVLDIDENGVRTLRFRGTPDIRALLPEVGRMPLPPYIRREVRPEDGDRYQTVYSRQEGAVAAPTAGLHFTAELLRVLEQNGVGTATVTLHVGPGTFQPVRSEDLSLHRMHAERYEIPDATAERIAQVRGAGGRIIAVGTTTVRTLETAAQADGTVRPGAGRSELFITPGFRFRAVDGMVTNFHLPKSTLIMLVSAFAGRERVLETYGEAVRLRYRFFSYGDAMLVL